MSHERGAHVSQEERAPGRVLPPSPAVEKVWHIRESRPDFVSSFIVEALEIFQLVAFSLGTGHGTPPAAMRRRF